MSSVDCHLTQRGTRMRICRPGFHEYRECLVTEPPTTTDSRPETGGFARRTKWIMGAGVVVVAVVAGAAIAIPNLRRSASHEEPSAVANVPPEQFVPAATTQPPPTVAPVSRGATLDVTNNDGDAVSVTISTGALVPASTVTDTAIQGCDSGGTFARTIAVPVEVEVHLTSSLAAAITVDLSSSSVAVGRGEGPARGTDLGGILFDRTGVRDLRRIRPAVGDVEERARRHAQQVEGVDPDFWRDNPQ